MIFLTNTNNMEGRAIPRPKYLKQAGNLPLQAPDRNNDGY